MKENRCKVCKIRPEGALGKRHMTLLSARGVFHPGKMQMRRRASCAAKAAFHRIKYGVICIPAFQRTAGARVELSLIHIFCSPVTTIIFAMDNYLRICGKIRGSMLLNILMSVLSAVLEFLFLFVFKWGIWGAALATCLGMSICALAAFIPFFRGSMQLRFCRPRFSRGMVRQIIVCGSPNFLNNIAGRLTSILMNVLLVRFGGEAAVSIYGILMYAEGFIQPLLYGMCDSLQPAVGYNWGAGALSRVKAIEKCCFTASAVLSVLAAFLIFLFPQQIAGLFMNNLNAEFAAAAVWAVSYTHLDRAAFGLSA